jgi:CHAD domain-containing protein
MRYSGQVVATVRETERKYDLDENVRLPRWSGVDGVREPDDPEEHLLEAVYFDTAGLDLAAAGITLRRRRGGTDGGWHLKLPAGGDSRDEIRVGFDPAEAGQRNPGPPAELVALTRAFTRGAQLVQVAELSTVRRAWRITDDAGRDLAEIVDDRVRARTLGEETGTSSWREVEVELAGGDPALLDRVERLLAGAGVRRADPPSKLARVLGERIPARRRPRTGRKATLGDVVQGYLGEQRDAIRTGDADVRRDLPDSVHKMRVATRRMRSALQAYGSVIDRRRTGALADELKWLAAVLGADRDLEVLQDRITAALDDVPVELVLGPVRAEVTRYFSSRRAAARTALIAALDGDRYLALLSAIEHLLAEPPLTAAARQRARGRLGALLRQVHARVAGHVRGAAELPQGHRRDTELHDARKAAKRLRYATEAAAPVLGEPARKLIARTRDVQELLGDHQDSSLARPILRDLAIQAHLDGGNGFTFGLLHARETAHLADEVLGHAWPRLERAAKKLAKS